jgi:hypothetical protein
MALVPDIVFVFDLNGERKRLEYRKLPFSAWSELKASLGFTPTTLVEAMRDYDLEAFGAIIWLERKQRERMLRWVEIRRELERNDVDLEAVDVIVDGVSTLADYPEPEPEPDPTQAGS